MTDTEPQPQQHQGQISSSTTGDQTTQSAKPANKSNSNDAAPRHWGRRGSGR